MSRRWRFSVRLAERIRTRNDLASYVKQLQAIVLDDPTDCDQALSLLNQALPLYRKIDDEVRAVTMECFKRRWKRKHRCRVLA